jgi:hypothetical protein
MHDSGSGLAGDFCSAIAGVVVDDDHFVDNIRDEEVINGAADVPFFVIGREDDADCFRTVHS